MDITNLEYREIEQIRICVEAYKMNIWNNLAKQIKKGTSFDDIKQLNKEFNDDINPWKEEGRCNSILHKIEDIQRKVAEVMIK